MITIKSENPVKLESVLQVSAELAEKAAKIKKDVIKHVLRDLHINHMFEGTISKAGVLVDHDIDIEQKCDELKNAHMNFLKWLEDYGIEEKKTDATVSPLKKYVTLIRNIKKQAAKEGIGICAFIENNEIVQYTGFMPDKVLAARTLALNEND